MTTQEEIEISTLQDEIDDLISCQKLSSLQEQFAAMTKERDDLIGQLEAQHAMLMARHEFVKEQLAACQKERDDLKQDITDLEGARKSDIAEHIEMQKYILSLERSCAASQACEQQLRDALSEMEKRYEWRELTDDRK